jgi:PAS domain S-box-containing protein
VRSTNDPLPLPPASSISLFGPRAVTVMLLATAAAVAAVWWSERSSGLIRPFDRLAYPSFVALALLMAAGVQSGRISASVGLRSLALVGSLFLGAFVPANLLSGHPTVVYDVATLIPWLVVAHLLVFAAFTARVALGISVLLVLGLASALLLPTADAVQDRTVRAMVLNGVVAQTALTLLLCAMSRQVFQLAFGVQPPMGAFADVPRTLDEVVAERQAEHQALQQQAQDATAVARSHAQEMLAMLQAFPGFVARVDAEGMVTHINPPFAALHGRTVDDALGRHVRDFLGDEGWSTLQQRRRASLQSGQPVPFERTFVRPDGSSTHIMGTQFPVPDAQGRPTEAFYQLALDASELRQVQRRLEESLAQIDALFEALPLPTLVKDTQGRYVRVNRAYTELTGLRPEAVIGRDVAEHTHPDNLEALALTDRLAIQTRRVQRFPIKRLKADGGVREMILYKAAVFGPGGEPLGMVGTLYDVTEVNTAARLMADARAAAESANAAKSAFLATMSHEIRTPMNGVIGMAELLLHDALPAGQRRSVQTILDSAQGLLALLDDILDFSKVEAGRMALVEQPLDLRASVETVCAVLAPVARRAAVLMSVDVDPLLPERVLGDDVRLRQILTNLLSNAIKFSGTDARGPHGGGSGGRVRVSVQVAGEQLRLSVADNGIGVSRAVQARLFEPFVQGDAATTRRFGGSGLGLAIVRRLVTLMGGDIAVESAPGEGASFTVTLPLHAAPVPSAAPAPAPLPMADHPALPCRVLMVEDDAVNCVVLSRQLELLGYDVTVAHDGEQALQAWQGGGIDLVLTDLHMPGMDGMTLARHIRDAERQGRSATPGRTPILALSANALRGDDQPALEAGMDAYLTKPIAMDRLREALARWRPRGRVPRAPLVVSDNG